MLNSLLKFALIANNCVEVKINGGMTTTVIGKKNNCKSLHESQI